MASRKSKRRSGRSTAKRAKAKAKAKPKAKAKVKAQAKAKPRAQAKAKPRAQAKAKPRAQAQAKPRAKAKAKPTAKLMAAAPPDGMTGLERLDEGPAAPPEVQPEVALYDLVCSDEGRIGGGLEFAACMDLARKHNDENPGHDADCYQQAPQDPPQDPQ